ncbi:unnamed protein product [Effrenium voratum]|nr:unnamed protein product [Effrenium voratum]
MADVMDGESSSETEVESEGSFEEFLEEPTQRGREVVPRVISSSWQMQLASSALRLQHQPWLCKFPAREQAMLRQAGWNAENYMRMDGILQAFEDESSSKCSGESLKPAEGRGTAALVAYFGDFFFQRFLPLWVRNPSAISLWLNFVKEPGLTATHVKVRKLNCPEKHGPARLAWLQHLFAEMQDWNVPKASHSSMTVGDFVAIDGLLYIVGFDGFYVVNFEEKDMELVRVEDTFGALETEEALPDKKGKKGKKKKKNQNVHTSQGSGDAAPDMAENGKGGGKGKGKKKGKGKGWQPKGTWEKKGAAGESEAPEAKGKGKAEAKGHNDGKGHGKNYGNGGKGKDGKGYKGGKGYDAKGYKGKDGKGKGWEMKGKGKGKSKDGKGWEQDWHGKGKGKAKGRDGKGWESEWYAQGLVLQ